MLKKSLKKFGIAIVIGVSILFGVSSNTNKSYAATLIYTSPISGTHYYVDETSATTINDKNADADSKWNFAVNMYTAENPSRVETVYFNALADGYIYYYTSRERAGAYATLYNMPSPYINVFQFTFNKLYGHLFRFVYL